MEKQHSKRSAAQSLASRIGSFAQRSHRVAHIEQAVVEFAIEQPAYGQVRVSHELKQQGMLVSPGGVHSIWLRHDLETFTKRLKALEAKSAQENIILTEA